MTAEIDTTSFERRTATRRGAFVPVREPPQDGLSHPLLRAETHTSPRPESASAQAAVNRAGITDSERHGSEQAPFHALQRE